MKLMNLNRFTDGPVCIRVIYAIALILAITAITLIVLDITEVYDTKLCLQMAFSTGSILLNNIALCKYNKMNNKNESK